jgi:hypothetical protein
MPPPAINTGLFVTRWTDLQLDEFHYPLNDGGSKPAFGRRSDSAANVRYGSFASEIAEHASRCTSEMLQEPDLTPTSKCLVEFKLAE